MNQIFARGVLREELFVGVVTTVEAQRCFVNLEVADEPSGRHFETARYGRGEVGELILIESQTRLFLGRIVAVRLADRERAMIGKPFASERSAGAQGEVLFLGAVRMEDLRVEVGMPGYPRLGDRCFSAPHELISHLPALAAKGSGGDEPTLPFARIGNQGPPLAVTASRLFGRHCAIVGATGGGKSYTTSRLVEETLKLDAKVVLIDATGEYASMDDEAVHHAHLGTPLDPHARSTPIRLPASDFVESDFMALFQPSGKTQAPKLQEAIRSLRLIQCLAENGVDKTVPSLMSYFSDPGYVKKHSLPKKALLELFNRFAVEVESTSGSFDVSRLSKQLSYECVWLEQKNDSQSWGGFDDVSLTHVASLRTRIKSVMESEAFRPVFSGNHSSFGEALSAFLNNERAGVLRLCMGGVSYEYRARELMANAVARRLLTMARKNSFKKRPLIVFVDEAHNFMGRTIGDESAPHRLDAFELIAREGRKYGLILCLATQRPCDLTESVLSQMGTMIVHRLTNAHDREVVERASGDLDRRVAAFLPTLAPGEAVLVGADLPIPLTVHVDRPTWPPLSMGPKFGHASSPT